LLVGPSIKQIKELQEEQERLNYLFRKGRIPVNEYEKEIAILDKKVAELREQHQHQSDELRNLQKLERDLDFVKQALEKGYWQVEYQAIKEDIQTTWDAALTVDSTTGEVVTTEPRADKKIRIDFTKALEGDEAESEVINLMTHGNGKIALRQLFDRLHITVHVYHDRFEIRGLLPNGNNNISSLKHVLYIVFSSLPKKFVAYL